MSDWDDLEKEFAAPGQWRATGVQQQGDTWESLEKQTNRKLTSARTFPQDQTDVPAEPISWKEFDSNPAIGGVKRAAAQVGSGMADTVLGFQQMTGNASKEDADAKRKMDAPLKAGFWGGVNTSVGKTLPYLTMPAGLLPRALGALGPILEGGGIGGLMGAMEPVGTGESRGANVGVGTIAGAAIPGGAAMVQRAGRPKPELQPLVQSALQEGIPLSTTDVSTNKLIKAFRSFADDLPFTGGYNEAQRDAKQAAFNQAVGRRWGSSSSSHTDASLGQDKARIGSVMDQVWGSNNMPYDSNLFGTLRQFEHQASMMPQAEGQAVLRRIQDIEQKVIAGPNGDLYIPGEVVNSLQKDLFKKFGKGGDERSQVMMDLRGQLLDQFNRNVTGPEAAALTEARSQWRAMKAVEKGLQKAESGMAQRNTGDVRPIDLSSGVTQVYGNAARSPYGDLPQIGQKFLRDTTPQTGGSPRALIQNYGPLATGAAALGGVGMFVDPITSGILAGGFYGANRLLNSPGMRARLAQRPQSALQQLTMQRPQASRMGQEALANAFRRAPAVGALGAARSYGGTGNRESSREEE
jgi:hypothetical protein